MRGPQREAARKCSKGHCTGAQLTPGLPRSSPATVAPGGLHCPRHARPRGVPAGVRSGQESKPMCR
eukprot:11733810-Alexandrium_andersonii.AAC.1